MGVPQLAHPDGQGLGSSQGLVGDVCDGSNQLHTLGAPTTIAAGRSQGILPGVLLPARQSPT